jgi:hypothetical protein
MNWNGIELQLNIDSLEYVRMAMMAVSNLDEISLQMALKWLKDNELALSQLQMKEDNYNGDRVKYCIRRIEEELNRRNTTIQTTDNQ